MKTKPRAWFILVWRVLTDVPGWPDAPFSQRLRRSLPILVPALAAVTLLSWHFGYAVPRVRSAYRDHDALLKLERQVAELNLAFSGQQVDDLANRRAVLLRQLPQSVSEVRETLAAIEREAQRLGWEISLSPPTLPDEPAAAEVVLAEVPVRARLKPAEGNAEPFTSLLSLLERVSALSRRIGLMRLSISADEGRWQSVEFGLRFSVPFSHAQAAP